MNSSTASAIQTIVPVSVKLDDENFLTWKMQASGTIKSFKLQQFIDFSSHGGMPNKFKDNEAMALGKISDDYANWEQQDQIVYTWLLDSMSPTLHVRMVGCNHAHQIWKSLHTYFESQTRAKVCQLKTQLKGIRKTDSLNNYLLSIKDYTP
uniref:Retrotransposon Copia-like N-terminal domain-containing protein n=1 Tax=Cajanus cajan TaxID=3821 RepID=A0A151UAP1_CAJCA|nr:hypothetical protein KK1_020618 [Cajanus cajan]